MLISAISVLMRNGMGFLQVHLPVIIRLAMCIAVIVYVLESVRLVLGRDELRRGGGDVGQSSRRFVLGARQLRRTVHPQPQLPVARRHASHAHRTLQRYRSNERIITAACICFSGVVLFMNVDSVVKIGFITSVITLRAKLNGAVYCNWSCLFVCLWVCYHDNSKLRASIFTKLGL